MHILHLPAQGLVGDPPTHLVDWDHLILVSKLAARGHRDVKVILKRFLLSHLELLDPHTSLKPRRRLEQWPRGHGLHIKEPFES